MKKVRGYKRYLQSIKNSIGKDSQLNLEFLNQEKYFNFEFEDWYGTNIGKGKGRRFILENILRIYNDWESKLKELDIEYYLAIWLCDPRLELSEIVCGIDAKIDYYENEVFLDSMKTNIFTADRFKPFENQLNGFDWIRKVDLDTTFEWEMNWPKERYVNEKEYYSDQRVFRKLRENAYRIVENENGKVYFRHAGDIWVGRK